MAWSETHTDHIPSVFKIPLIMSHRQRRTSSHTLSSIHHKWGFLPSTGTEIELPYWNSCLHLWFWISTAIYVLKKIPKSIIWPVNHLRILHTLSNADINQQVYDHCPDMSRTSDNYFHNLFLNSMVWKYRLLHRRPSNLPLGFYIFKLFLPSSFPTKNKSILSSGKAFLYAPVHAPLPPAQS